MDIKTAYAKEIADLNKRMETSIAMMIELSQQECPDIDISREKEFMLSYIKDCPIETKKFIIDLLDE